MSKRPPGLSIASFVLLVYVVVDLLLSFGDSRNDLQALILATFIIPAILLCWRGNHFAYFFCLVLVVFLGFNPIVANLNAPDRLLTPLDVPVAIALLILFLTGSVRGYFKNQRQAWRQRQKLKAATLSQLQPLFFKERALEKRGVSRMFWKDEVGPMVFLGSPLQGYRLENMQHAMQVRDEWVKTQRVQQWAALVVFVFFVIVSFLVLKFILHNEGQKMLAVSGIFVMATIPMLLMLVFQLRFQKRMQRRLKPTSIRANVFQLMDLIAVSDPKSRDQQKKVILFLGGALLVFGILNALLISPKIIDMRQHEQVDVDDKNSSGR